MSQEEGYVTTEEGVRLFFRRVGEGPGVVAVPNGMHLLEDFRPLAVGRSLLFYDVRNRGLSDSIADPAKRARGVHHDVEDLEALRRHFGFGAVDLIGHSYMGTVVALYAMRYPESVRRIVQIGPMEPFPGKAYPAHLTGADAALQEIFAKVGQVQQERGNLEPVEFCRRFWAALRPLYVTDPADAGRIASWERCDLPNELGFMSYWLGSLLPSLQGLDLQAEDFARVKAPVLTIHGRRDRSAPYGGGREWAMRLPEARLVTVENGGHAPWIEAPGQVFGAIAAFLDGRDGGWPEGAEKVGSLE